MYYSAIGLLAWLVLLIENQDILLNRNQTFERPAWKTYRRFLVAVQVYYITDIIWGVLENRKLATLLFVDTSVYFVSMAFCVLFWTRYVVDYMESGEKQTGRFLVGSGRVIATLVTTLTGVNIFTPVLFTVDEQCVYHALTGRYIILSLQILLLVLVSIRAFYAMIHTRKTDVYHARYRTVGLFGLIVSSFLFAQFWFPYLPLYGIAYMLGTCLLRSFVVVEEKEEYRGALIEAEKTRMLKQSISALLDNMPALTFSKDAKTGVYLACNQAFAEYAHKEKPEGVVGLTDAEIFDPVTAEHFVEDDRMALSMEEPYIFFEDVPDAAGNQRQFQTTKLKYIDTEGRLCTLGMCQDVTDMIRIQREHAMTKEAYEKAKSNGIIYTHIAQTLARGYEDLYYVNLETEEFIEYHTDDVTGMFNEVRRGQDFFAGCKKEAEIYVYQEDRADVQHALNKETLIDALSRNGTFFMTYRLLSDHGMDGVLAGSADHNTPTGSFTPRPDATPFFVRMKVSRMEDDDRLIIIGVTDVDEEMKQRRAVERVKEEHLAYSRLNALAGDFVSVYVVDPETEHFREFSSTDYYKTFELPEEGEDFFAVSRQRIDRVIFPDDHQRFLSMFNRREVMEEIEKNGIFALTYRLMIDGKPTYVQLKATIVEEQTGKQMIVGINIIDSIVRQEEEYAKRLAQAQSKANIDALTGVKNKHAYLDEEERLDQMIGKHQASAFAIVVMDLNDLKKVNDTQGHQAGDQYICDACKYICDTFKKSPVFRVGGDEFAVIAQGDDYTQISGLLARVEAHNEEAVRNGGMIIACGYASYENDRCVAEVFERADTLMYENKNVLKKRQEENG